LQIWNTEGSCRHSPSPFLHALKRILRADWPLLQFLHTFSLLRHPLPSEKNPHTARHTTFILDNPAFCIFRSSFLIFRFSTSQYPDKEYNHGATSELCNGSTTRTVAVSGIVSRSHRRRRCRCRCHG
jgi:hypothetical protein